MANVLRKIDGIRHHLDVKLTCEVMNFDFEQFDKYFKASGIGWYNTPEDARNVAMRLKTSVVNQLMNSKEEYPVGFACSGHLELHVVVLPNSELRVAIQWVSVACPKWIRY